MFPPVNEQMDIIKSFAVEVFPEDELVQKIEKSYRTNKPLNIKLGCDPSRPDLHIGHSVVLRKLRQFQDLGHKAILIVGDFTAMIGDPSGRSKTRPALTLEETRINGKTYLEQATKILSTKNLEVRFNSEWLGKMTFSDVIKLASKYTVSQILERDDFSIRFKNGIPISIHEFLYPLAQAMDSVAIEADVELGGTDQKFNLIVGREIQKAYGLEPQCIVLMPILEGTDGKEKMSKSLGNYIAITDTPREMFGKVMSIPDELILKYYKYATFPNADELQKFENELQSGILHPRNAKVETAKRIVSLYHSKEEAEKAHQEFEKIFAKKEIPDEVETFALNIDNPECPLVEILVATGLSPSKKEARRMIEQGGVYVDGNRISDINITIDLSTKKLIKYGKRKFLYVQKG
ncbi:tyrosine--tRNA ligase [Bacteroidetes/Chlorobi group bacterium Naka2016]|jgi:tyrosyl-tRNA synthetase|nr:MAG: tyrosine--tRNA ligase [Bacteroidetes/Chlorobi group bacterium Naka2016]